MMNFFKKQKGPARPSHSGGFTLIETLIAIFILTLTVGGLLELAAGGYFAVRYARNQIVANNLIQESLEYVRNTRDTALQSGGNWATWLAGYTAVTKGCAASTGCIVDPYATSNNVRPYPNGGEAITFFPSVGSDAIAFYGYKDSAYSFTANTAPYLTSYKRVVTMTPITIQKGGNPDQVIVNVTITWSNGNSSKSASQSILLSNWQVN